MLGGSTGAHLKRSRDLDPNFPKNEPSGDIISGISHCVNSIRWTGMQGTGNILIPSVIVQCMKEFSDEDPDVEDLLYVLRTRFGNIERNVEEKIFEIKDFNKINRLILVAANVNSFEDFLFELTDSATFKIVGNKFDPLGGTDKNDRTRKQE